jgi:hypothetical protein
MQITYHIINRAYKLSPTIANKINQPVTGIIKSYVNIAQFQRCFYGLMHLLAIDYIQRQQVNIRWPVRFGFFFR